MFNICQQTPDNRLFLQIWCADPKISFLRKLRLDFLVKKTIRPPFFLQKKSSLPFFPQKKSSSPFFLPKELLAPLLFSPKKSLCPLSVVPAQVPYKFWSVPWTRGGVGADLGVVKYFRSIFEATKISRPVRARVWNSIQRLLGSQKGPWKIFVLISVADCRSYTFLAKFEGQEKV